MNSSHLPVHSKADSENVKSDAKNDDHSISEREAYLSTALESITDGFIMVNNEGLITVFNANASNLIDIPVNEALGKPIDEVFVIIHSRSERRLDLNLDLVLINRKISYFSKFTMLLSRNKNSFFIEGNISPVIADDNILGTVITFRDNTEKYKLAKTIREKESKLKAKLEFILSPGVDFMRLKLLDVIELSHLNEIQESFSENSLLVTSITNPEGKLITQTFGNTRFCNFMKIHGKTKWCSQQTPVHYSDELLKIKHKTPKIENCQSCDVEMASAPLIVGGQHLGNWHACNLVKGVHTLQSLKPYLNELNDNDTKELTDILDELPTSDNIEFKKKAQLLWILAGEISSHSYNNMKMAREIEISRAAEKSLRQSETYLNAIFSSAQHAYVLLSKNNKILKFNEPALKLMNSYSDLKIELFMNFMDIVGPRYVDIMSSMIEKCFLGNSSSKEIKLVNRKGELQWLELKFTPAKNSEDAIFGASLSALDITSKKLSSEALIHSEEMYRRLIQTSPDAIIVTRLDNLITLVSPNALKLLAYAKEKSLMDRNFLICIDDKYESDFVQNIELINSKEYIYNIRTRFIRGNHSSFYGEVNAGLLRDPNGNPSGIIYNIRDITERRSIENELIKAKQKAEESDNLKSAFLANMSHEIRTPMNGILGFANLLQDDTLPSDLRDQYIEIINSNSKSLMGLIDDIIDIAKIEAGQLKIRKSFCQLSEIFESQFIMHQEMLLQIQKKLKLKISIPQKLLSLVIETDPFRLKQILNNLISNAIKFTQTGSVEFGFFESAPTITCFVKDTGIGMDLNNIHHIFDRFRQIEHFKNRQLRGTGLGLAICKNLVELLEGEIWVESELDAGSTFFFSLPIGVTNVKLQDSNSTSTVMEQIDWSEKRILVAEDEEVNFFYLKEALKKTGIMITHVETGLSAVDAAIKESFDLILMDIKMPELDGLEATRRIRKINSKVPVLALTAYAMNEDRDRALEAGCNGFIAKPVRRDELISYISMFI